jgi:hypothetical protein
MASIKLYINILIELLIDSKTEIKIESIEKTVQINPFTFQKTTLKAP